MTSQLISTLREQITEIVADAINRWKDAAISGNADAWADVGSKSATDATEAILALLPLQPEGEAVEALAALRGAGWAVAVHNDYRLNGEPHTFWLFTHADGRWIKGEGRTDAEAIRRASEAHAKRENKP